LASGLRVSPSKNTELSKYLQVCTGSLIGLLLGIEVVVLLFIPDWVQPEGLAASAIWGAIVSLGLVITLPAGLVSAAIVFFLDARNRKRVIVVESILFLVLALVILVLLNR
jgi:hypothetical protein